LSAIAPERDRVVREHSTERGTELVGDRAAELGED
jgi:hypothetical protein